LQIGKKTVIFLLIFSIISVSITIFAIIYTKMHWSDQSSTVILDNESKASSGENAPRSTVTIGKESELSDTYSRNPLKITEKVYTTGTSTDSNYQEKIKITYPEISNLSDLTVRTNINNEIKEKVLSLYTEDDLNNQEIKHIEIDAEVTANFSDVMSVRINVSKQKKSDEEVLFTGLNYRLENGEHIKFKNLFINGASIKTILRHNAYNSLAWEYKKGRITDMSDIDYSLIYDDLYDVMEYYENNENPEFYFDEKEINVKLNGKKIAIAMMDAYNQISVYNKYVSQSSIYSQESLATDIPVYTARDEYAEMDVYMVAAKNLIIDMSLNVENLDRNSSAINTAIENYKAALNNAISVLKSNSTKEKGEYVYFIARVTAEVEEESNKIVFKENTYKYTAYNQAQFGVYITSPILSEKRKSITDVSKVNFDLQGRSIKKENLSGRVEYNLITGNPYGENEVKPIEPEVPENPEEPKTDDNQNQTNPDNNDDNSQRNNTNTTENVTENNNTNTRDEQRNTTESEDENITATITY